MFNIFAKLYNLFSGISETKHTFRNIRKNNNWICMEDGGYIADDEKSPKSREGDEEIECGKGGEEEERDGGEKERGEDKVMVDGLELILLKTLKI